MTAERTALVTGVAGQDGMYVSRLLLERGWRVVGTTRPGSRSVDRMQPYLRGVEVVVDGSHWDAVAEEDWSTTPSSSMLGPHDGQGSVAET